MTTKKYLSLERLAEYDSLIKDKINEGDEGVKSYVNAEVAKMASSSHTHDDRYYTESEIDTKLSGKSDTGHKHYFDDIEGGVLTVDKGGTSASTIAGARANLDVYSKSEVNNLNRYSSLYFANATSTYVGAPSDEDGNFMLSAYGEDEVYFIAADNRISFESTESDEVIITVNADPEGSADAALEEAKSYADDAANKVKNDLLGAINEIEDGLVGENTTGTVYTINNESVTAAEGAEIFNDYTNNKAVGKYSHAEGSTTIATGDMSHAEGGYTESNGINSHAEGGGTTASGDYSHAEGGGTTASGNNSHAEGGATTAYGHYSHAEGQNTSATGNFSHTEGQNTSATRDASHAEGQNTTASGFHSHAEGLFTEAIKAGSHAEGYGSKASGDYSHAEGFYTESNGKGSHAEGGNLDRGGSTATSTYTVSSKDYSEITTPITVNGSIAQGIHSHVEGAQSLAYGYASHAEGEKSKAFNAASHAEGANTKSSGYASHAEGQDTKATGMGSHAEGMDSKATGDMSHAEGNGAQASGTFSHAEGLQAIASALGAHAEGNNSQATANYAHAEGTSTVASGENSHAEGSATTASGAMSHAEGNSMNKLPSGITSTTSDTNIISTWNSTKFTLAKGQSSHAEGENVLALNAASHAEGQMTIASGAMSHAEGWQTKASSIASHAEGNMTEASGFFAHAEGNLSIASGDMSHAEGYGTIAKSNFQHVEGQYNIEDSANKYAHIVGNGSSKTPSNAHTLDWDGNAWYQGNVYVGGTSQDDASQLATTTFVEEKVAALVDSAPDTLNTLNELATAITSHQGVADTLNAAIGDKQNKTDEALNTTNKTVVGAINELKSSLESSQPDWSQNDENAPGYIQNRPFYESQEQPYIVLETTLDGFYYDSESGQHYRSWDDVSELANINDFQVGDLYEFYVNDELVETSECRTANYGDIYIEGSIFYLGSRGYISINYKNKEYAAEDVLTIKRIPTSQIKQLDIKYIPDTIARKADIPEVDLTSYQTKSDEALNTTDKTIVGAINELNTSISDKANATHTHAISDITDLETTLSNTASAIAANTDSITAHSTAISNLQTAIEEIEEVTSAEIQALFSDTGLEIPPGEGDDLPDPVED